MAADRVRPDASNRGPLVNIINWILLVVMCLAALLKVFTKWILIRNLQYDDAFTLLSMVFAAACGIAVTVQASAGLGKHRDTLSYDQTVQYQKSAYASQMLYTITLGLAKQTVLQLFALLQRNSSRVRIVYAVSAANAISTIVLLFGVAFQCPTSSSWDIHSARCFDQAAFWKAFEVIDISMIVATAVLANFIFYDLHMPLKTKIPVVLSFCSEVGLIPLIVLRLVYVVDGLKSSDYSYDEFLPTVMTLVCVYSAVVVACIPFLKPVLKGIQSGVMGGDIRSMATLDNAQYLFSKNEKFESGHSRSHYGMKRLKERGDSQERIISQDRIITQTKEVRVEVSKPKPVYDADSRQMSL